MPNQTAQDKAKRDWIIRELELRQDNLQNTAPGISLNPDFREGYEYGLVKAIEVVKEVFSK